MGTFHKIPKQCNGSVMLRYSVQVKSAYPLQMLKKLSDFLFVYFCILLFLLHFWYMKPVVYLIASHIMDSIHFMRLNRKAAETRTIIKRKIAHTRLYSTYMYAYLCSLPLDLQSSSATIRLQTILCRSIQRHLAPHIIFE